MRTGEDQNAYFETRFPFDPKRDLIWTPICQFLQKRYIPESSIVLDLGAGYCSFINHIKAKEKHAVDIFPKIAEFAGAKVITHIHSCMQMDFLQNNHFDVVFASNLLEHLTRSDSVATVMESARILKRGGKLILLQPNFRTCPKTYFDDYTHLQIFTDRSLCDFLEANGFKIIESKPRFLPLTIKSTSDLPLPKLSTLVSLYLRIPFKPFAGQMLVVAENRKTN